MSHFKQQSNSILLNYPKLKGNAGGFSTRVVPARRETYDYYPGDLQCLVPKSAMSMDKRRYHSETWIQSEERGDPIIREKVNQRLFSATSRYSSGNSSGYHGYDSDFAESVRVEAKPQVRSSSSNYPGTRGESSGYDSAIGLTTARSSSASQKSVKKCTSQKILKPPRPTSSIYTYDAASLLALHRLRGTKCCGISSPSPKEVLERLRQNSIARRIDRLPAEYVDEVIRPRCATVCGGETAPESTIGSEQFKLQVLAAAGVDRFVSKVKANREKEQRMEYIHSLLPKVIRIIIVMYRILKVMIQNSEDLTTRTAIELQWYAKVKETNVNRRLNFDKTLFEQKGDYDTIPKWARILLSKSPDDRTRDELMQLHAMLRGLKAFDKFTYRMQMEMCRTLYLIRVQSKRVILRKGHHGFAFYFIYSGSVFVNVEEFNPRTQKMLVRTEVVLSRGDGFGELALLRNIKRAATIVCREQCELLCVEKHIFAQVCPRIFEEDTLMKVKYIGTHPIFVDSWDPQDLHDLCAEASISEHSVNKVISIDSAQDPSMYFVMSGSCRVIKVLTRSTKQLLTARSLMHTRDSHRSGRKSATPDDEELTDDSILLTDQPNKPSLERRQSLASLESSFVPKSQAVSRDAMLNAMELEYANQPQARGETVVVDEARADEGAFETLLDQETKLNAKERERKAQRAEMTSAKQKTTSFTVFIDYTRQLALMEGKTAIILEVGQIAKGEVFNLRDNPKAETNSTILISEGCKLLRVGIKSFLHKLYSQDHLKYLLPRVHEHIKEFASDDELLKLYIENCHWEAYKQKQVNDSICLLSPRLVSRSAASSGGDKPWRASPEEWLAFVNEQRRQMRLKENEPLKPPIY